MITTSSIEGFIATLPIIPEEDNSGPIESDSIDRMEILPYEFQSSLNLLLLLNVRLRPEADINLNCINGNNQSKPVAQQFSLPRFAWECIASG